MVIRIGGDGQRMRLHKILCLGILFCVLVRQDSFAQCGEAPHKSAVSTMSADSTSSSKTGKEY
ncbi:MAG: hypothetical protein ACJ74Y_13305, partial [Bryobacteraceae bacterium]